MWIMQIDVIHKQLCVDTDSIYQLSRHPAYLLLARLLLISCKEFIRCFEVCFCDAYITGSEIINI